MQSIERYLDGHTDSKPTKTPGERPGTGGSTMDKHSPRNYGLTRHTHRHTDPTRHLQRQEKVTEDGYVDAMPYNKRLHEMMPGGDPTRHTR